VAWAEIFRILQMEIANTQTHSPPLGDPSYPTSDGRPIAETDWHRNVLGDSIETLKSYFAGQQVYVTGALLLFYEEGKRAKFVAPDVFVVRGLVQCDRLNYLLWQESRTPNVVIEITSASTRNEDIEEKLPLYRDKIGVAELFLFDPRQEYLCPSLQGHRWRTVNTCRLRPSMDDCRASNSAFTWKPIARN
jgi:Uma2 family endonuclease